MSFQLSDHDLQQYEELGYAGPFKLLESHEVEIMTRKLVAEKSKFFFRNRLFSRIPGLKNLPASVKWGKAKWYKAMHIVSPLTREIASRPEILDRITSIIGEEMLMWGAMMLTIKQSDRPAWHLDDEIEFLSLSEAASVWIALTNVTEESGLRIITRSHKIPRPTGLTNSDEEYLAAARKVDPKCECITIPTKPGEFFIFPGRIWHTGGKQTGLVRNSLLLQYCQPEVRLTVPAQWGVDLPVPCISVSDKHPSINYGSTVGNKVLLKLAT